MNINLRICIVLLFSFMICLNYVLTAPAKSVAGKVKDNLGNFADSFVENEWVKSFKPGKSKKNPNKDGEKDNPSANSPSDTENDGNSNTDNGNGNNSPNNGQGRRNRKNNRGNRRMNYKKSLRRLNSNMRRIGSYRSYKVVSLAEVLATSKYQNIKYKLLRKKREYNKQCTHLSIKEPEPYKNKLFNKRTDLMTLYAIRDYQNKKEIQNTENNKIMNKTIKISFREKIINDTKIHDQSQSEDNVIDTKKNNTPIDEDSIRKEKKMELKNDIQNKKHSLPKSKSNTNKKNTFEQQSYQHFFINQRKDLNYKLQKRSLSEIETKAMKYKSQNQQNKLQTKEDQKNKMLTLNSESNSKENSINHIGSDSLNKITINSSKSYKDMDEENSSSISNSDKSTFEIINYGDVEKNKRNYIIKKLNSKSLKDNKKKQSVADINPTAQQIQYPTSSLKNTYPNDQNENGIPEDIIYVSKSNEFMDTDSVDNDLDSESEAPVNENMTAEIEKKKEKDLRKKIKQNKQFQPKQMKRKKKTIKPRLSSIKNSQEPVKNRNSKRTEQTIKYSDKKKTRSNPQYLENDLISYGGDDSDIDTTCPLKTNKIGKLVKKTKTVPIDAKTDVISGSSSVKMDEKNKKQNNGKREENMVDDIRKIIKSPPDFQPQTRLKKIYKKSPSPIVYRKSPTEKKRIGSGLKDKPSSKPLKSPNENGMTIIPVFSESEPMSNSGDLSEFESNGPQETKDSMTLNKEPMVVPIDAKKDVISVSGPDTMDSTDEKQSADDENIQKLIKGQPKFKPQTGLKKIYKKLPTKKKRIGSGLKNKPSSKPLKSPNENGMTSIPMFSESESISNSGDKSEFESNNPQETKDSMTIKKEPMAVQIDAKKDVINVSGPDTMDSTDVKQSADDENGIISDNIRELLKSQPDFKPQERQKKIYKKSPSPIVYQISPTEKKRIGSDLLNKPSSKQLKSPNVNGMTSIPGYSKSDSMSNSGDKSKFKSNDPQETKHSGTLNKKPMAVPIDAKKDIISVSGPDTMDSTDDKQSADDENIQKLIKGQPKFKPQTGLNKIYKKLPTKKKRIGSGLKNKPSSKPLKSPNENGMTSIPIFPESDSISNSGDKSEFESNSPQETKESMTLNKEPMVVPIDAKKDVISVSGLDTMDSTDVKQSADDENGIISDNIRELLKSQPDFKPQARKKKIYKKSPSPIVYQTSPTEKKRIGSDLLNKPSSKQFKSSNVNGMTSIPGYSESDSMSNSGDKSEFESNDPQETKHSGILKKKPMAVPIDAKKDVISVSGPDKMDSTDVNESEDNENGMISDHIRELIKGQPNFKPQSGLKKIYKKSPTEKKKNGSILKANPSSKELTYPNDNGMTGIPEFSESESMSKSSDVSEFQSNGPQETKDKMKLNTEPMAVPINAKKDVISVSDPVTMDSTDVTQSTDDENGVISDSSPAKKDPTNEKRSHDSGKKNKEGGIRKYIKGQPVFEPQKAKKVIEKKAPGTILYKNLPKNESVLDNTSRKSTIKNPNKKSEKKNPNYSLNDSLTNSEDTDTLESKGSNQSIIKPKSKPNDVEQKTKVLSIPKKLIKSPTDDNKKGINSEPLNDSFDFDDSGGSSFFNPNIKPSDSGQDTSNDEMYPESRDLKTPIPPSNQKPVLAESIRKKLPKVIPINSDIDSTESQEKTTNEDTSDDSNKKPKTPNKQDKQDKGSSGKLPEIKISPTTDQYTQKGGISKSPVVDKTNTLPQIETKSPIDDNKKGINSEPLNDSFDFDDSGGSSFFNPNVKPSDRGQDTSNDEIYPESREDLKTPIPPSNQKPVLAESIRKKLPKVIPINSDIDSTESQEKTTNEDTSDDSNKKPKTPDKQDKQDKGSSGKLHENKNSPTTDQYTQKGAISKAPVVDRTNTLPQIGTKSPIDDNKKGINSEPLNDSFDFDDSGGSSFFNPNIKPSDSGQDTSNDEIYPESREDLKTPIPSSNQKPVLEESIRKKLPKVIPNNSDIDNTEYQEKTTNEDTSDDSNKKPKTPDKQDKQDRGSSGKLPENKISPTTDQYTQKGGISKAPVVDKTNTLPQIETKSPIDDNKKGINSEPLNDSFDFDDSGGSSFFNPNVKPSDRGQDTSNDEIYPESREDLKTPIPPSNQKPVLAESIRKKLPKVIPINSDIDSTESQEKTTNEDTSDDSNKKPKTPDKQDKQDKGSSGKLHENKNSPTTDQYTQKGGISKAPVVDKTNTLPQIETKSPIDDNKKGINSEPLNDSFDFEDSGGSSFFNPNIKPSDNGQDTRNDEIYPESREDLKTPIPSSNQKPVLAESIRKKLPKVIPINSDIDSTESQEKTTNEDTSDDSNKKPKTPNKQDKQDKGSSGKLPEIKISPTTDQYTQKGGISKSPVVDKTNTLPQIETKSPIDDNKKGINSEPLNDSFDFDDSGGSLFFNPNIKPSDSGQDTSNDEIYPESREDLKTPIPSSNQKPVLEESIRKKLPKVIPNNSDIDSTEYQEKTTNEDTSDDSNKKPKTPDKQDKQDKGSSGKLHENKISPTTDQYTQKGGISKAPVVDKTNTLPQIETKSPIDDNKKGINSEPLNDSFDFDNSGGSSFFNPNIKPSDSGQDTSNDEIYPESREDLKKPIPPSNQKHVLAESKRKKLPKVIPINSDIDSTESQEKTTNEDTSDDSNKKPKTPDKQDKQDKGSSGKLPENKISPTTDKYSQKGGISKAPVVDKTNTLPQIETKSPIDDNKKGINSEPLNDSFAFDDSGGSSFFNPNIKPSDSGQDTRKDEIYPESREDLKTPIPSSNQKPVLEESIRKKLPKVIPINSDIDSTESQEKTTNEDTSDDSNKKPKTPDKQDKQDKGSSGKLHENKNSPTTDQYTQKGGISKAPVVDKTNTLPQIETKSPIDDNKKGINSEPLNDSFDFDDSGGSSFFNPNIKPSDSGQDTSNDEIYPESREDLKTPIPSSNQKPELEESIWKKLPKVIPNNSDIDSTEYQEKTTNEDTSDDSNKKPKTPDKQDKQDKGSSGKLHENKISPTTDQYTQKGGISKAPVVDKTNTLPQIETKSPIDDNKKGINSEPLNDSFDFDNSGGSSFFNPNIKPSDSGQDTSNDEIYPESREDLKKPIPPSNQKPVLAESKRKKLPKVIPINSDIDSTESQEKTTNEDTSDDSNKKPKTPDKQDKQDKGSSGKLPENKISPTTDQYSQIGGISKAPVVDKTNTLPQIETKSPIDDNKKGINSEPLNDSFDFDYSGGSSFFNPNIKPSDSGQDTSNDEIYPESREDLKKPIPPSNQKPVLAESKRKKLPKVIPINSDIDSTESQEKTTNEDTSDDSNKKPKTPDKQDKQDKGSSGKLPENKISPTTDQYSQKGGISKAPVVDKTNTLPQIETKSPIDDNKKGINSEPLNDSFAFDDSGGSSFFNPNIKPSDSGQDTRKDEIYPESREDLKTPIPSSNQKPVLEESIRKKLPKVIPINSDIDSTESQEKTTNEDTSDDSNKKPKTPDKQDKQDKGSSGKLHENKNSPTTDQYTQKGGISKAPLVDKTNTLPQIETKSPIDDNKKGINSEPLNDSFDFDDSGGSSFFNPNIKPSDSGQDTSNDEIYPESREDLKTPIPSSNQKPELEESIRKKLPKVIPNNSDIDTTEYQEKTTNEDTSDDSNKKPKTPDKQDKQDKGFSGKLPENKISPTTDQYTQKGGISKAPVVDKTNTLPQIGTKSPIDDNKKGINSEPLNDSFAFDDSGGSSFFNPNIKPSDSGQDTRKDEIYPESREDLKTPIPSSNQKPVLEESIRKKLPKVIPINSDIDSTESQEKTTNEDTSDDSNKKPKTPDKQDKQDKGSSGKLHENKNSPTTDQYTQKGGISKAPVVDKTNTLPQIGMKCPIDDNKKGINSEPLNDSFDFDDSGGSSFFNPNIKPSDSGQDTSNDEMYPESREDLKTPIPSSNQKPVLEESIRKKLPKVIPNNSDIDTTEYQEKTTNEDTSDDSNKKPKTPDKQDKQDKGFSGKLPENKISPTTDQYTQKGGISKAPVVDKTNTLPQIGTKSPIDDNKKGINSEPLNDSFAFDDSGGSSFFNPNIKPSDSGQDTSNDEMYPESREDLKTPIPSSNQKPVLEESIRKKLPKVIPNNSDIDNTEYQEKTTNEDTSDDSNKKPKTPDKQDKQDKGFSGKLPENKISPTTDQYTQKGGISKAPVVDKTNTLPQIGTKSPIDDNKKGINSEPLNDSFDFDDSGGSSFFNPNVKPSDRGQDTSNDEIYPESREDLKTPIPSSNQKPVLAESIRKKLPKVIPNNSDIDNTEYQEKTTNEDTSDDSNKKPKTPDKQDKQDKGFSGKLPENKISPTTDQYTQKGGISKAPVVDKTNTLPQIGTKSPIDDNKKGINSEPLNDSFAFDDSGGSSFFNPNIKPSDSGQDTSNDEMYPESREDLKTPIPSSNQKPVLEESIRKKLPKVIPNNSDIDNTEYQEKTTNEDTSDDSNKKPKTPDKQDKQDKGFSGKLPENKISPTTDQYTQKGGISKAPVVDKTNTLPQIGTKSPIDDNKKGINSEPLNDSFDFDDSGGSSFFNPNVKPSVRGQDTSNDEIYPESREDLKTPIPSSNQKPVLAESIRKKLPKVIPINSDINSTESQEKTTNEDTSDDANKKPKTPDKQDKQDKGFSGKLHENKNSPTTDQYTQKGGISKAPVVDKTNTLPQIGTKSPIVDNKKGINSEPLNDSFDFDDSGGSSFFNPNVKPSDRGQDTSNDEIYPESREDLKTPIPSSNQKPVLAESIRKKLPKVIPINSDIDSTESHEKTTNEDTSDDSNKKPKTPDKQDKQDKGSSGKLHENKNSPTTDQYTQKGGISKAPVVDKTNTLPQIGSKSPIDDNKKGINSEPLNDSFDFDDLGGSSFFNPNVKPSDRGQDTSNDEIYPESREDLKTPIPSSNQKPELEESIRKKLPKVIPNNSDIDTTEYQEKTTNEDTSENSNKKPNTPDNIGDYSTKQIPLCYQKPTPEDTIQKKIRKASATINSPGKQEGTTHTDILKKKPITLDFQDKNGLSSLEKSSEKTISSVTDYDSNDDLEMVRDPLVVKTEKVPLFGTENPVHGNGNGKTPSQRLSSKKSTVSKSSSNNVSIKSNSLLKNGTLKSSIDGKPYSIPNVPSIDYPTNLNQNYLPNLGTSSSSTAIQDNITSVSHPSSVLPKKTYTTNKMAYNYRTSNKQNIDHIISENEKMNRNNKIIYSGISGNPFKSTTFDNKVTPSADISSKNDYDPYGYMIPKFNTKYEDSSSNINLWEKIPPKRNTYVNSDFGHFNRALAPNKETNINHNDSLSDPENHDTNLNPINANLKSHDKSTPSNSYNYNYNYNNELFNDLIKQMTDKMINKINNLENKISELDKVPNKELNNEGNDKITSSNREVDEAVLNNIKATTKPINDVKSKIYIKKFKKPVENIESGSNSASGEDKIQESKKSKKPKNKTHKTKRKNKEKEKDKKYRKHRKYDKNYSAKDVKLRNKNNYSKKKKTENRNIISSEDNNSSFVKSDENYKSKSAKDIKYKIKSKSATKTKTKNKLLKDKLKHERPKKKRAKETNKEIHIEDNSSNGNDTISNRSIKKSYVKINSKNNKTKTPKKSKKRKTEIIKGKSLNNHTIKNNNIQIEKSDSDTDKDNKFELVTIYPISYRSFRFPKLF